MGVGPTPRSTSWPNALGYTSNEDLNKNVARFLDYDPFTVIAREDGTVGALRSLAQDVDTVAVHREIWRARYEEHPSISSRR
jgi:hypothetical protein